MHYLKASLLIFLFTLTPLTAQNEVAITFDSNKVLRLNDLQISDNTTYDAIKDILGVAQQAIEKRDGGVVYIYDNGLSIDVISSMVISMSINFNWDGDTNVSETSFTGTFLANNIEITRDTGEREVQNIQGLELMCPFQGMCMSQDKTPGKTKVIVAFEDSKITQFGFLLNK